MKAGKHNSVKNGIFNDPIYGFISIPDGLISRLIDHPLFQRLRRIEQLGLTHLVYPGAIHTRFHHSIGTMHLMTKAIEVLRSKGHHITEEEAEAVKIAILLHDIGHGPFSHTLEHTLVNGISHEDISMMMMRKLNRAFDGAFTMAIKIFRNQYKKKFLHHLVTSQLDMDRLDYLRRDSFFCGVAEGIISSDRIIKTLNVIDDELAIEYKGIYAVESFIISRRLMYWQVYLHKTVISAEYLLINILKRAQELALSGTELFASPAFKFFLHNQVSKKQFIHNPDVLDTYALLDDFDVMSAVKVWASHRDPVLSSLSKWMIDRNLYKIDIRNKVVKSTEVEQLKQKISRHIPSGSHALSYFVFKGKITNNAYNPKKDRIKILFPDGKVSDIADAADLLNISVLSRPVNKYFICYPKAE